MLRLLSFLILTSLILSCSQVDDGIIQENHSILEAQRLVLREGKLVNRICTKAEKGECTSWSEESHDIQKKEVRDHLNNVGFVCAIKDKRYFLCPEDPAFCRRTLSCAKWKKRFLRKDICIEYQVEQIPLDALSGILVDCSVM